MPTINADAVSGSDTNNGSTPALAVKTLQVALDLASELPLPAPWSWQNIGNVGYRTPMRTVQMAPAPASTPYLLPQAAFLTGGAEVLLRGDPAAPLDYNIFANNSLQGLTAQNGAHLVCDGFTIRGAPNCTSINGLANGKIAVKNIYFGGVAEGMCCPMGAAGGSQLDVIGKVTLIGSGFIAVFSAIEFGRIVLAPANEICLGNAMNFGIMFNMMQASTWTQGYPPNFTGAIAGSTGQKFNNYYNAFIGFDHNLIPGSPGAQDYQNAFPVTTSHIY